MRGNDPSIIKKQLQDLENLGWYHSIQLPNGEFIRGFQSIEQLRMRVSQFPIPDDLTGKRVLDIGAWDGWFSFEMERRGAEVTAVDSATHANFVLARDLVGSKVHYQIGDVCRLSASKMGQFDIVLFLGVLYHLKHPILGLERVCELSTEMACVESFVTDDGSDLSLPPTMEFYETTELCGQFDNWVGPNTSCLLAMCRTAGFARVKLESVRDHRAHVTCYRKWPEIVNPTQPPPYITSVENATTRGREFSSEKDEYVAIWFKSAAPTLSSADVFPQIGGYGSSPVFLQNTSSDGWHLNCKLPPGLSSGWHLATVRTRNSEFGNSVRIGIDLTEDDKLQRPATTEPASLRIMVVTDGKTWERNVVRLGPSSCISIWISGLPDDATARDVSVWLNGSDLPSIFLSEPDDRGVRQVNAMLPTGWQPGDCSVAVASNQKVSDTVSVRLVRAS